MRDAIIKAALVAALCTAEGTAEETNLLLYINHYCTSECGAKANQSYKTCKRCLFEGDEE